MLYYLIYKYTNGHLSAILFKSSAYFCIRYREQSSPPISPLSVIKWKSEKSEIQDIVIIGIASTTIVHNKKAHIPFFSHPVFFSCIWPLYLHPPFQLSRQIQCSQGMTFSLGKVVYAHPAITGGEFPLVFAQ